MEDFVKRMVDEYNEVNEFYNKTLLRYNKLLEFLQSEKFKNLNFSDTSLLYSQQAKMRWTIDDLQKYMAILKNRIELHTDTIHISTDGVIIKNKETHQEVKQ